MKFRIINNSEFSQEEHTIEIQIIKIPTDPFLGLKQKGVIQQVLK